MSESINAAPPVSPQASPEEPQATLIRRDDALADLRADADAAHHARVTGQPRGPLTGLKSLDLELGGALSPGIHILHGNAGTGKTAIALQIAASCRCPSLFVSCEMAISELLRRHTARTTGKYLGRLKNGEMTGADVQALASQALEAAPLMYFMDATRAPASPKMVQGGAEVLKNVHPDHLNLLIVVDSLHSWAEAHAEALSNGLFRVPEYDALNIGIAALRQLAHTLKCPVLVISERNRDSMNREGSGINSGAGSRKIEYGAETVISLDRKPEAKEDAAGEVEITLKLAKNRHGAAGKPIALRFNGALQSFREA